MSHAVAHRRRVWFSDLLRLAGSVLRVSETIGAPVMDLLRRITLAQIFLASGIVKLADWDTALLLAREEYPVSWMDPVLAAYVGVSIEIICPIFLLLGLMTRFAALPMLILSVVIQMAYQPVNAQVFWIILFGWWVVMGAGPLSLDHAFRGLRDSALPLARPLGRFFAFLKAYAGPLYTLFIRFWIAAVLYIAGHSAMEASGLAGHLSLLHYQPQLSVLRTAEADFFVGIISTFCAFCIFNGFGTRIIALLTLAALSVITVNVEATMAQKLEYAFWLMLLSILFFRGPGKISLDHVIRAALTRRFPELEGHIPAIDDTLPHVVIVGAGFGGVTAARTLRTTACRVTLIDKHNYHLFQPLLYQVATAGLSPSDIAVPIRSMFRDQQNIRILLGEVTGVDKERRNVQMKDGRQIGFDYLVLATGAQHSYFGKDEWAPFAPGMKRVEDAIAVRGKLLRAFEAAENATSETERARQLTFVIVGGGPTGVELAGALAELAHQGMVNEFRNFDPATAKICLVEAGPKLLGVMPDSLSAYTQKALEGLGVTVMTGGRVEQISPEGVKVGEMFIPSGNVFWAAGVQASPAAQWLGGEADRAGRLKVSRDLTVSGMEGIYAIGDTVLAEVWKGKPMPGLAPAAKQSGKFVAKHIRTRIEGGTPEGEFHYRHYGSLATIGRKAAVADFGKYTMKGAPAWWFWGAIHVMFLANMRNRIAVMIEWFWAYLTFRRSTRLITEVAKSE